MLDGVNHTIEIGPVVNSLPPEHGVVSTGPVGARWAGRFRIFRYELRRWPGGRIPDLAFEAGTPIVLSRDRDRALVLLGSTVEVPRYVWGRDEAGYGEMWNSNSVISWLLMSTGLDPSSLEPPSGGSAPGWRAGIAAFGDAPG
jgi:hypothetical protein